MLFHEMYRYGLTENEVAKLEKSGVTEDLLTELAYERLAANAVVHSKYFVLEGIQESIRQKHKNISDPVIVFLSEVMLTHTEEGMKAAQMISDWLDAHKDDHPEEFDKEGIVIPTKRSVKLYWAMKTLGEDTYPELYQYGGKLYDFILTEIIKDETVRKAILEVKSSEPVL